MMLLLILEIEILNRRGDFMQIENALLDETESYLKQNKETMPSSIYNYLIEVVKQDRQYIQMVKQWSQEKKVFKV